jgi:hypothetical protein
MPHRPGHGTQRRRIERQSRGQTATPISRGAQQAANTALVNAEINRLNRFVDQNQDKKQQFTENEVIKDMPDKFKDRFINPDGSTKTYDQMNEADKTIFNFYDDGRSDYQRQLNRFVQSSPESAQAFAKRFPLENFLQKAAPVVTGIMTGLPLGAGTIYDQSRRLGTATVGGLKDIAMKKGIIPRDDINPNTGTTSVQTDILDPIQGPPAYDATGLAGYQDAIMKEVMPTAFTGVPPTDPQPTSFTGVAPTGPQPTMFTGKTPSDPQFFSRFTGRTPTDPDPVQRALPTDAITQGIQSLFTGATPRDPRPVREQFSSTFQQPFDPPMIPGGIPRGSLPVREGRLLGQDPNVEYGQELSLLDIIADNLNTRGFQEGGLASINNPQYNMLMNASDFDI